MHQETPTASAVDAEDAIYRAIRGLIHDLLHDLLHYMGDATYEALLAPWLDAYDARLSPITLVDRMRSAVTYGRPAALPSDFLSPAKAWLLP